jgi:anti-sigma factor RsiW
MQCRDFREMADSYLSDELLIETNHDMMRHLETCVECRGELAARRELRSKLREGFQRSPELQISDDFVSTLKAQLQNVAERQSRLFVVRRVAYVLIAASLAIAALFGFRFFQLRWGRQNPNPNDVAQSERSSTGSTALDAALAESAAGDHRDCALHHRLPERPIPLDEAGRIYDRVYLGLVNAVMSGGVLPADVELVGGHSCVFKGRRFGHVVLKYHGQLISVLVSTLEAQERSGLAPTDQFIADPEVDGYQLAHFDTARHTVYVVSSLNSDENMLIARAIEPSLSRHISNTERAA